MSKDENPQSNISGKIDSAGGLVNSGSINTNGGDVIGRDKIVYGDEVQGDKIVNITRLDLSDTRSQRNHAALRKAVRIFWIDGVDDVGGVLKNSLYNELLLRLDMEQQPDAVNNRPWNLILQQPEQPDLAIADDKRIIDIFNHMGQQMLILGEPGSGKTITLLTLADALLLETQVDPTLPTPVVFNLSSWAEKQPPLDEWLVEELNQRYHMPRKVSQNWVENDELLLLLDGFDEVAADKRDACVSAINAFQKEHIVSMVVCSRIAEYQALTDRLNLTSAITIRPLTEQQINGYIASADPHLTALDYAINSSPELRELAKTPLMLSIMTLTYHDQHKARQSTHASNRSEQQHLFDRYIRRMFQHRDLSHLYTPAKTLHWLQWLADQMVKRNQTTFYIERLQPDWLGGKQLISLYQIIVRLCGGMIFGLIGGLIFGLLLGPSGGLRVGLMFWLIFWLFDRLRGAMNSNIIVREEVDFSWRSGLSRGLRNLMIFGVIGGLSNGLRGLLIGVLMFGLIEGLRGGIQFGETKVKTEPNQGIWQSLKNGLFYGLIAAILFGLSGGVIYGVQSGLMFGLKNGTLLGVVCGLLLGLSVGLHACTQHLALRTILTKYTHIPFNYARFLDYAALRLLLRKVGGGYIFIHRMVLEHIAALTDADIARITADLEGG